MPYQNLEELPQDAKELPQGAQQEYMAAFNAAESDGLDQSGAKEVAWNSVKMAYEKGSNGQWQHRNDAQRSESSPLGNVGSSGT
jgi:cation transport regulator